MLDNKLYATIVHWKKDKIGRTRAWKRRKLWWIVETIVKIKICEKRKKRKKMSHDKNYKKAKSRLALRLRVFMIKQINHMLKWWWRLSDYRVIWISNTSTLLPKIKEQVGTWVVLKYASQFSALMLYENVFEIYCETFLWTIFESHIEDVCNLIPNWEKSGKLSISLRWHIFQII